MYHDFSQQRIVVGRDDGTGVNPGIYSAVANVCEVDNLKCSWRWDIVLCRIFSIHSGFYGCAFRLLRLQNFKLFGNDATFTCYLSVCLPQHQMNEVDVVAELSDTVLDLQSCVHLKKEEFATMVIDQVFDCACRAIVDGFCETDSCRAETFPKFWTKSAASSLI